jgi:general secretion pathway protein J
VGVNATQDGQPADTVVFLTLSQFHAGNAGQESEMIRIVYTRENDRLLRFIRRNLYGMTDETIDQSELAKLVKGFNLRYYDSMANAWLDEWDGRSKTAPPAAMLIELMLLEDNDEVRTFRQWVPIGMKS